LDILTNIQCGKQINVVEIFLNGQLFNNQETTQRKWKKDQDAVLTTIGVDYQSKEFIKLDRCFWKEEWYFVRTLLNNLNNKTSFTNTI
jgi:hypothetical protein